MTGKNKKKKAPVANGTSLNEEEVQHNPESRNGHKEELSNGSKTLDSASEDCEADVGDGEEREAESSSDGQRKETEDTPGPSGFSEVDMDAAVAKASASLQRLDVDGEQDGEFRLTPYTGEHELGPIMSLISRDLSEPYSIYTYRYFIHNWPHLCFLARPARGSEGSGGAAVGVVVCKLDMSRRELRRGYIAMLAVDSGQRRKGLGSRLVRRAIQAMRNCGCDEVVLETEVTNSASLRLYQALGFVRDKRLFRYYLNGVDAFRLKLWLTPPTLPFQFPSFHHT